MEPPQARAPRGRHRAAGACAAAALAAAACVTVRPTQQPAADFAAAAAEAQSTLSSYFSALNDYERRLYLADRLYDPALKVSAFATSGGKAREPTPLLAAFKPEAVQARLDALALLAAYGKGLADLSSSDAPSQATGAGAALGQQLAGLGQRLSAPDYAGPVAAMVALLGEMSLGQQRDVALRDALERGAPAFRRIVDLLEIDLREAVKDLRSTGADQRLAEAIAWYNGHAGALAQDVATRRLLLADIEAAARSRQAFAAFDPTRLTQALRDAHEALVRLASSPRAPQNMEQCGAAMKVFAAEVAAAAQSASRVAGAQE
jgi:hypothetical protein